MGWGARIEAALFQSVTSRTAGFNTVPIGRLGEPALLVLVVLMAVGGSPGSTAGGLKTTSLATMILMVRARLRGREAVSALGRTIPARTQTKVFALLALSLVVLFAATLVLLIFERDIALPEGKGLVTCIGFEVVSAFATVGLSTGITPEFGPVGKLVLIVVMFAGRLGPLTFIELISQRVPPLKYRYPEEDIIVG
jgi:trk system potassium uptake protein TrkH